MSFTFCAHLPLLSSFREPEVSKFQHVCYRQVSLCADSAEKHFISRELHLGLATPGLHGTKTQTLPESLVVIPWMKRNTENPGGAYNTRQKSNGGCVLGRCWMWNECELGSNSIQLIADLCLREHWMGLCPDVWEGDRAEHSYPVYVIIIETLQTWSFLLSNSAELPRTRHQWLNHVFLHE